MFLFAVTRQRITGALDGLDVRAHATGGRVVTTATDGQFSSERAGPGRITVEERAPNPSHLLLAEVSFAAAERAVELHKPLIGGRQVYYHFAPNGDFFCASHAQLLRAAGVRLEEDPERLPEFFIYRYVTAPRTLFRGIDQLIAGQRLRFEFDGRGAWRRTAAELYTPPQPDALPTNGANGHAAEYGRRTGEAMRDAMRLAAPADGSSPHVLMSGGLDSSILFKMAQADLGVGESSSTSYPFEPEAEDVEKRYALTAAEAMGARHRFFCPTTPEFLRGVLEATAVAEEPVVHMQSVLLMLLFRDGLPAGPGTVVVGQGADGAFGLKVHDRVRRLAQKAERYRRWQHLFAKPPVLGALRVSSKLTGRGRGAVEVVDQLWQPDAPIADPRHVLWWLGATGDPRWVRRRFPAGGDVNANRAAAIAPYQGRSAYDLISLLDFIGDVSVTQSVWSKLGEASGKWVYYPFNDPGVLDAAFAAPWEVKLAEPKRLLRDVARRVGVPEFIITRPKANFNANAKRWAAPGAAFEPLVPLAAKVFGKKELRRMQSPDDNPAYYTFWTMLTYAVWRRLVLDGVPLERLAGELDTSMAESAGAAVGVAWRNTDVCRKPDHNPARKGQGSALKT